MSGENANFAGIADWSSAANYPDEVALVAKWREQGFHPGEATILSMWRWEFLRRRPDYRAAYAEQDERSRNYWDDLMESGTLAPWQRRSDFENFGARHLSDMAARFGLEIIPSPDWEFCITTPPLFCVSYGSVYRSAFSKEVDNRGRHKIDARIEGDQILVTFDLSLPLSDQFKRARDHLEAIQAERNGAPIKPPRNHRRLWGKYLRVLDAREAGETFESIWEKIELAGLSVGEFDARADSQNWPASGRQLWTQARDLMFKITT